MINFLRVFLSQFEVARRLYQGFMDFRWGFSQKQLRNRLIKTATYPEDAIFPLSPVLAKTISRGLSTTKPFRDSVNSQQGTKSLIEEDPNPYFDVDWYELQLKERGIDTDVDPFQHYLMFGRELHLNPSPLFTESEYLKLNPDLRKSRMNLLYHYMTHGQSEGRVSGTLDLALTRIAKRFEEIEVGDGVNLAIVVPVFNNWLWTDRALRSVLSNTSGMNARVIVVDDCSSDLTIQNVKSKFPEVEIFENEVNLGFLKSCNQAFRRLSQEGCEFIYLLNNDAEVLKGFLNEPLRLMSEDASVGLVGSKLIFPNGKLQEAGGIIWSDATGWNYGRNQDLFGSLFDHVREVDYVSGAAVLLRVAALERVNFFDSTFAPAYYEDTDIAFAMRANGFKTLFCPASIVIHHEGKSHGTSLNQGIKRHQEENRVKFRNKWTKVLTDHYVNDHRNAVKGALRLEMARRAKTILWFDYQLPDPSKDSGSVRAEALLKIARKNDFLVIFVPANGDTAHLDPHWIQRHGVVVCQDDKSAFLLLDDLGRVPDIIWFSRVEVFKKYYEAAIQKFPNAETVFDTVDLHFLRLTREASLTRNSSMLRLAKHVESQEIAFAASADKCVVVSDFEKSLLETNYGLTNVQIVSNVHSPPLESAYLPEDRRGLVFVGSFNHHPNISGISWFLKEVWPLLPEEIKQEGIKVVGPNPPKQLRNLSDDQIEVVGWVPSSSDYVSKARISVAPILVGAGVKGKIGEAFQCLTPVVATVVAAEGMGIKDGETALVRESPQEFAEAIITLFDDLELAKRLTGNAARLLDEKFGIGKANRDFMALFRWSSR